MQIQTICSRVTGIVILIGSLGCLKEVLVRTMDMILGKRKFQIVFFLNFSNIYVVDTRWNCLIVCINNICY